MSQTPYTPRDPFSPEPVVGEQRVSGLAIASFVTSLLCCIPGVGAVAAVLGIGAIVSISRSHGRLSGRALAFIAIVLGLLGTMLYIGIAVALSQIGALMRPYYATVTAIEAGDMTGARSQMTSQTAAVTDERITQFREEYRALHGTFQKFPDGVGELVSGYVALGPRMQLVDQAKAIYPGKGVWPMPATFDNGEVLVVLVVEDSASGGPRIANLGIEKDGSSFVWLIDPQGTPRPAPSVGGGGPP